MLTVGNIIDQLSILEQRLKVNEENKENIRQKTPTDAFLNDEDNQVHTDLVIIYRELSRKSFLLKEQRGWLLLELARIIVDSHKNKRPIMFKKHKNYDQEVNIDKQKYFLEAVDGLKKANERLWQLEDMRRERTLSDAERLTACDSVAINNKIRNDFIDAIDEIVNDYLPLKK